MYLFTSVGYNFSKKTKKRRKLELGTQTLEVKKNSIKYQKLKKFNRY